MKEVTDGIAKRLLNELSRISALYNTIDDGRPDKIIQGDIVKATVNVENIGQTLQQAVSADSKLSLGFFQIPLGAILGVVGRIVQGPGLTGSLHKDGDTLTLIAQVSGGKSKGSWRVTSDDLYKDRSSIINGDTGRASIETLKKMRSAAEAGNLKPDLQTAQRDITDKMVRQLACRIFTDLVNIESPRWRAVANYTEGLRLYRDTLRVKGDNTLSLREAEKAFIRALAQDNRYAYNHYNLGIVYRNLAKANRKVGTEIDVNGEAYYEAARISFTKAVNEAPTFCAAYYALALNYYDLKQFSDVIRVCEQVINIRPDDALAWNLKGCAHKRLAEDGEQEELNRSETVENCRIATALAWRRLCFAALKGESGEKLRDKKDIARTCTLNLASAYGKKDHIEISSRLYQQAINLSPADADTYFELGIALLEAGRFNQAEQAFRSALCVEDQPSYWACLAYALVQKFENDLTEERKKIIRVACKRAINCSRDTDERILKYRDEIWKKLGETPKLGPSHLPKETLDKLQKHSDETESGYVERLESDKAKCQSDLLHARLSIKLANLYLESGRDLDANQVSKEKAVKAEGVIKEALKKLEEDYPVIIRKEGLYALLASALMHQDKLGDALHHAEYAAALNPNGCKERTTLGEIYFKLHHYDRAEAEWETALSLNPGEDTIKRIAYVYWERAFSLRDRAARRAAYWRAIELFSRALAIAESKSYLLEEWQKQIELCGTIHYQLSWFYHELNDFSKSTDHIKVATSTGSLPLESRIALGICYVRAKAYNEAEAAFRDALREARKQYRKLKADHHSANPNAKRQPSYNELIVKPANDLGETKPINRSIIVICQYRALAFAQRGVRLEFAEKIIHKSLKRISLEKKLEKRDKLKAFASLCLGIIRFKQGMIDQAIDELEKSVSIRAEVDAYYYLAEAYYHLYMKSASNTLSVAATAGGYTIAASIKSDPSALLARAHQCLSFATEADLSGRLDVELDNLRMRLEMSLTR